MNGHIPSDVFYGRAQAITSIKQRALDDAYSRHPERFVNGAPKAKAPPAIVAINPLPASVISLPAAARNNEIQKPDAKLHWSIELTVSKVLTRSEAHRPRNLP